jgi:nitrate reductase NapE component
MKKTTIYSVLLLITIVLYPIISIAGTGAKGWCTVTWDDEVCAAIPALVIFP